MTTVVEDRQKFYVPVADTGLKRRRNRYDILAEILSACKERSRTQSWLLLNLGLSTRFGKSYIDFLVATQLLESIKITESSPIYYATTIKGNKALRIFNILTTKYFIKCRFENNCSSQLE